MPKSFASKRKAENSLVKEEFFNQVVKSVYREIMERKAAVFRQPSGRAPKEMKKAMATWVQKNWFLNKGTVDVKPISKILVDMMSPDVLYQSDKKSHMPEIGRRLIRALRALNEIVEKDIEEQGFFDITKGSVGRCIRFDAPPFVSRDIANDTKVRDIDWLFRSCLPDPSDGTMKFPKALSQYYINTYGMALVPISSFKGTYDNNFLEDSKHYWGAQWESLQAIEIE